MLFLFLLTLSKKAEENNSLTNYANWNWISILSVTILLILIFLIIFQSFFKSKTAPQQPKSFLESSVFLDNSK